MELGIDPLYRTERGAAYLGDSLELLKLVPDESIDLVLTSPPFPLASPKKYGNVPASEWVEWMLPFCRQVKRVLKSTGSFVLDLRGSYLPKRPVRSIHNYKILVKLVDDEGWSFPQDYFWANRTSMPAIHPLADRLKNAVNTIWWLSPTDYPKTRLDAVLNPYSDTMKHDFEHRVGKFERFPSGHTRDLRKWKRKKGAIPPNYQETTNCASNTPYQSSCRIIGTVRHPARFNPDIPSLWINFLTDPRDLVLDIFGGSNVVGMVAEELERNWLTFEYIQQYLAASVFRFVDFEDDKPALRELYDSLMVKGAENILVEKRQKKLIREPLHRVKFERVEEEIVLEPETIQSELFA